MLYYGLKNRIAPSISSDPLPLKGLAEKILALNDLVVILTASKNKIVHCSRSVQPILGIPASQIFNRGWEAFFERIHPDDQKLLTKKLQPDLRRQLKHLSPEEQLKCSFNYTFRIRNGDNRYTLVALENQLVQVSDRKSSWIYMSVLKNISPYGLTDEMLLTITRKSADCGWETLFEKRYPMRARGLTVRESQVMHLIGKGLSSREIAEKLFLSPETVRCHRKNLMRKMRCKTSAELVSQALHVESNGGDLPVNRTWAVDELKS